MKVFYLALLTVLLAALWTGSQGVSFRSSYGPCCYKEMIIRQKIPIFLIRSYQETSSHCSRKAVRVELRKGRKFCVDPEADWFRQYQQQQEMTRRTS
ncbi:CCL5 protein, partial [Ardeotis kori]|nr:CCL5 protein [Ardeotis kori]